MERLSSDNVAVSVVIPAFQAKDTILRALASVAAQTRRPREVIVVDDGSKDDTFSVARAYAPAMHGIQFRVLCQANAGAGSARNKGVWEATQPIIAFLDADDEWLPEKLERSLAYMERNNFVLVAHNSWIVDDGRIVQNDCARRFRESRDPFIALYRKGYIDTCTVLVRRDAVLAAGGFDETLPNAQDFDLWLAMLGVSGAKFLVFDEFLARYHIRSGSVMSHTLRRLACGMIVARRHALERGNLSLGAISDLWYRVAAIHVEAIRAYFARGAVVGAIICAIMVPLAVPFATFMTFLKRCPARGVAFWARDSRSMDPLPSSYPRRAALFLTWAWIASILIAYLHTFENAALILINSLIGVFL